MELEVAEAAPEEEAAAAVCSSLLTPEMPPGRVGPAGSSRTAWRDCGDRT